MHAETDAPRFPGPGPQWHAIHSYYNGITPGHPPHPIIPCIHPLLDDSFQPEEDRVPLRAIDRKANGDKDLVVYGHRVPVPSAIACHRVPVAWEL